jgi:hypothetical protein
MPPPNTRAFWLTRATHRSSQFDALTASDEVFNPQSRMDAMNRIECLAAPIET